MKVEAVWKHDLNFEATVGNSHINVTSSVPIDYKISLTPYELLLLSLASSVGISIMSRLHQAKQNCSELAVIVTGHLVEKAGLKVFDNVSINVRTDDSNDPIHILNAVEYSQFVSSGISEMLSRIMNIRWVVLVHDNIIGEGIANFDHRTIS